MAKEISLDVIERAEGEIIADSPRQWRADCHSGQFKIGSTTMRGNKLDLELVGAQISEGEYFGYPFQKWLALLFVDPDGILSNMLVKTESLDNFLELRRTYAVKDQSLLGKTIRATMSKRSSRASGNGYFAVEFEVASDGKYAAAIERFRAQQYSPALLSIRAEMATE